LECLVDYTADEPALNPAFDGTNCGATCTDTASPLCTCTEFWDWSATTVDGSPTLGWFVAFGDGDVFNSDARYNLDLRAVRGGS
jgi:hypothetical protein